MTCFLISGATGFVGTNFLLNLTSEDQYRVLSRNPSNAAKHCKAIDCDAEFLGAVEWEPTVGDPPTQAFEAIDTLVNFSGESVATGRWTEAKKKRIYDSRVSGTQNLTNFLLQGSHNIDTFLSCSAVGYYGFPGDDELTELSAPGSDFLSTVVQAWEAPLTELEHTDIRVITTRLGVPLGLDGGAFPQMVRPFKMFVGGRIGSGTQWVPWIHINDCIAALAFLIADTSRSGVYNIVAPQSSTNHQLTAAIAKSLHRPAIFPVPAFMLRILLGGFADVLLESQKVVPQRLTEASFKFTYPTIETAVSNLLAPRK
ncbi:MAG: TIGR01777 family oxidoreductase [Pirellulaceae bacterium]|nr:TIGR01777 family oxidoreductase [Pirellulaceae bacterium]